MTHTEEKEAAMWWLSFSVSSETEIGVLDGSARGGTTETGAGDSEGSRGDAVSGSKSVD